MHKCILSMFTYLLYKRGAFVVVVVVFVFKCFFGDWCVVFSQGSDTINVF